ncbi:NAD(P)/FAD-dependent oxidoreductase [Deinococcus arenicola]|uniref:Ferredoxin--NADP reductase n=1 Tax=Deinococcus arenicola TaxID=2994950 RepID=A0ABU4DUB0_9DEIO|nr:NAD(P)/FAD-dependent oxidoreductase [Deinococcus sp. ZS9-10]MDV6375562.1 NAD(P)/FAD-dependent oxidoreductase [Deinococcus sp. ZS9-10]
MDAPNPDTLHAENQHCDILIIGAGPAGLHAAFYAAWRGLSVRVLEARGEPGGQLSALYPDKRVYDVPGLPAARAADVVAHLLEQLDGLAVEIRVNSVARTLEQAETGWQIGTDQDTFTAGAVILAAGLGALLPRAARISGADRHPDLRTDLPEPSELSGRSVLIVGGVPQAARAALELLEAGAKVTLTHSRTGFRGDPVSLARLENARATGHLEILAPARLLTLTPQGAELEVNGETRHIQADTVLLLGGYLPDLSPIQSWPLDWRGEYVPDGPGGRTALDGVYVVGDLAGSGGDFKLISVAFAQAAVAANHATHFVKPELRVRPGHSSEKQ